MIDLLPPGVAPQGKRGIAFVVAGASGAGKISGIAALPARGPRLAFSVLGPARARRAAGGEGRGDYFLSGGGLEHLLCSGARLEWTIVQGARDGTPRAEVVDRLEKGVDVVLNVEVRGARALREARLGFPVVLIFLIPPSWEELVRRVRSRGTENEEALAERLRIARAELQHIPEFDYLVINDELERAVERVAAIVQAERMRIVRCA